MTPFFLLRMWLKRAPLQNRVSAAVAIAAAVAVLVWIAVPGSSPTTVSTGQSFTNSGAASGTSGGQSAASSDSGAAGAPGAGPAGGAAGAPAAAGSAPGGATSGAGAAAAVSSGGAGSPGANSPAGGQSPVSPNGPAGQTGVSTAGCSRMGSPIKVGVIMPDVGSGTGSVNTFFGIPSVSEIEADYKAVFDDLDRAGGVQCHPLVGDYQDFNELDSSQTETICLKLAQDGVFAAVGGFGPTYPDTCLLQNRIPTIEQIMISEADAGKYYPYYFSANGAYELIVKNFVYAVGRLGYLSPQKGFKKLGVLLRTCEPSEEPVLMSALAANGVSASQIDVFNFGCNSSDISDPPNEVSQAELQFWQDGVTDVTAIDAPDDLQPFTNDANSQYSVQHFKPQYLVPDDGGLATLSSSQNTPNGAQFGGAIGITGLGFGGQAAGLPESAATQRCDAIMVAHKLPTVYQSGDNFAGNSCDVVWMLARAMQNDPGLAKTGLAAGLARAGSVDMSYPDGPNAFASPATTWGGEFWREDVFYASCSCFKTVNPTFQKSF